MKLVRPLGLLLPVALACLALPAIAQDDKACSVATLKGTYGLHGSGVRLVAPTVQIETHSTIALRSYDGKGGLKSYPIVSNGTVTGVREGDGTFGTGTYEVNPDCTGKVSLRLTPTITIEARFVIVDRGLEIIEVPSAVGNVGVAILKRQ